MKIIIKQALSGYKGIFACIILLTFLWSMAFAVGDYIKFNSQTYPFEKDSSFEVVKIKGQAAILVWDKVENRVFKVPTPELDRESFKKFKK